MEKERDAGKRALTGLVECALCHQIMETEEYLYTCQTRNSQGPDGCINAPVDAGWLEEEVCERVFANLFTPENLRRLEEFDWMTDEQLEALQKRRDMDTEDFRKELEDQVSQGSRMIDLADAEQLNLREVRPEIEAMRTSNREITEEVYKTINNFILTELWLSHPGVRENPLRTKNYTDPEYAELTNGVVACLARRIAAGPDGVTIEHTFEPDSLR